MTELGIDDHSSRSRKALTGMPVERFFMEGREPFMLSADPVLYFLQTGTRRTGSRSRPTAPAVAKR